MVINREAATTLLKPISKAWKLTDETQKGVATITSEDVTLIQSAKRTEITLFAHGWLVSRTETGQPKLVPRVQPHQKVGALNASMKFVEPLLNAKGIVTVDDLVNNFTIVALAELVGEERAIEIANALAFHHYLMA